MCARTKLIIEEWPEWEKYLIPTKSDTTTMYGVDADMLNNVASKKQISKFLFGKLFADKVTFILVALGYFKDEKEMLAANKDKYSAVIKDIKQLLTKTIRSKRYEIYQQYFDGQITEKEYEYKNKLENVTQSRLDFHAGVILHQIIMFFGAILDNVQDIDGNRPAFALWQIDEFIRRSQYIDELFSQYKSSLQHTKGAKATATKRQNVRQRMLEILDKYKVPRPDKRKNNIKELVQLAKDLYYQETGEIYPNSDRTLANLLYERP